MQAEFFFAVEAPQAGGCAVVEQARGGHQFTAVEVTHADVLAVNVIVIHVQAQFGTLELGIEFGAEYAKAQRLGFAQGGSAV